MFCGYCGTEIEEDSKFCPVCGKSVDDVFDEAEQEQIENSEIKSSKPERGKGKPINSKVLISAIVLAVVVGIIVFIINSEFSNNDNLRNVSLNACVDSDDTAFLQYMNGNHISVNDVNSAYTTPDRKKIAVCDVNGELYIADSECNNKQTFSEKGSIIHVEDDYLIYRSDDEIFRYLYQANESVKMCNAESFDYMTSDINNHILYHNEDSVFLLKGESSEPDKIGKYDIYYAGSLLHIDDEGSEAYWTQENDDGNYDIYLYANGDRNKILTYSSPSVPRMMFNESKTYALLGADYAKTMYLIDNNGNTSKISMGNPIVFSENYIFTPKGHLKGDKSSSFPGAYVPTYDNDNNGFNLYFVDKKGEREKIISELSDLYINDNHLYYISDSDLRYAKLSEATLDKDSKITADVDSMVGHINNYVYIIKDSDYDNDGNRYGTLYVCKGGNEPSKISAEVWCSSFYLSHDGKTVYYFQDPDKGYDSGTMFKYSYGKKSSDKVSDFVCVYYINDGLANNMIGTNLLNRSFTYFRKNDTNDFDWIYYDGSNNTPMVKGLSSYDLH